MIRPSILALIASGIGGAPITHVWANCSHWYASRGAPRAEVGRDKLIVAFSGILERVVITALVMWLPAAVGPIVGSWIVIKAAGAWGAAHSPNIFDRTRYHAHLMNSMFSTAIAVACGLVWRYYAAKP